MTSALVASFQPYLNSWYILDNPNRIGFAAMCLCLEAAVYPFALKAINSIIPNRSQEMKQDALEKEIRKNFGRLNLFQGLIVLSKAGQLYSLVRLDGRGVHDLIANLCMAHVISMAQVGPRRLSSMHIHEYRAASELGNLLNITTKAVNIFAAGALLIRHSQIAMIVGVIAMTALSIKNMMDDRSLLEPMLNIIKKIENEFEINAFF